MALQSFTITVGAQVDVNGKNYIAGQVVYIKKLNGTLASIYSDLGGLSPIPQDGFSNVTNVDGQFTFYVETGEYNAESGGKVTPITVVGSDYFNSKINEVILELSKSRGFRVVGDFASGFTYELPNDVGVDGSGNYWIYTDVNALPVVVSAGTTPSAPTYTQVTFNDAIGVSYSENGNVDAALRKRAGYYTLAEAQTADLDVGQRITLTDYADASYEVVADTDTGGFYLAYKAGFKFKIIENGDLVAANLDTLNGVKDNDEAFAWLISKSYPVRLLKGQQLKLTQPLVTNKGIVIVGSGTKSCSIINDVPDSQTLLTQNGSNSKVFRIENLEITNPNARKNRIADSDLNIFEYTLKDLMLTDSFDGFFSSRQWVSPSLENVIFRNTRDTATFLAGAKCIYMSQCNTVDLSSVSMTGAWDYGTHLVNSVDQGNFTVSINNYTAQGVNGTDKTIGKGLLVEGGSAVKVGTVYIEKTREVDCLQFDNVVSLDLTALHIVQGSLTLNNCKTKLSSASNYVVNASDPAGLSSIKVNGGELSYSNLFNFNDYDFRYERNTGDGTIKGNLNSAIKTAETPINSGLVGGATAVANTKLRNLGFDQALTLTTLASGDGITYGISSANIDDGEEFIIAATVRILSGNITVRSEKVGGSATNQLFPVLHQSRCSSDKFQTIYFYSRKTADGAACKFTANGAGSFDIYAISYLGW